MNYVYDEENPEYMEEPHETVIVSSTGQSFYKSEMIAYGLHIEEEPPKKVVIILHRPTIQKKHHRRYFLRTR